jgi:cytidylate kinase
LSKSFVIAIDGPAGSGKSTVARLVAKELKVRYIDSGAIYRACTYCYLQRESAAGDTADIKLFIKDADLQLQPDTDGTHFVLNGSDISQEIRSIEVTRAVSKVAADPEIRDIVTGKLRELGLAGSSVVDGRDIGTVVFPDANLKIYMNASIEERAQRRLKDLQVSGNDISFKEVKKDIIRRDKLDSERAVAPLSQAADAVVLDTSDLSIEQSVAAVIEAAKRRHII